jgi:RNA polymerase sigma-70 factor (ECF subfamily)
MPMAANMDTDHQAIVEAAAVGDDQALELLVRAYHDRVYRFGLRVCRDPFDAEDAVQDAFVALSRRPDVVRHPGALSWLMTVVRNACLRLLRPLRRTRALLEEHVEGNQAIPSPQLDPEAALERWRLVHLVHRAIAALERPYREVLVLRDLEGQTGEQVCAALGLTEAAMKSRLHRARATIREKLAGWRQEQGGHN